MSVRIQMRRGTTSEWNSADPILNEGEIGYNSTLTSFKIGDGTSLWSALDYYQAAADITPNEIGAIASTEKNAVDGVAILDGSKNVVTALSVVFEGATADAYETFLTVTEPASDITINLPSTADTLVGRATTDTLTNKSISGATNTLSNIGNASLTNSAITINGSSVSLGGSISIGDITGITTAAGSGLSGGGSSGDITLSIDTAVTADLTTAQTLTNKTLTSPSVGTSLTTASTSFNLLNTTATTINFGGAATVISIGAVTGTTTINDDLVVTGDLTVNGTTTTINSQTLSIEDKNIILADANTSDVGADGGGITLKGATDKTFNWVDATDAWTSSEHLNLASGKSYYSNGTLLKDVSETLTNKTISGASNTITVRLANDVSGTLPIANGGTGATTAMTAATALLPDQTSNSGKYLTNNGAGTLSWGTVSAYSAPTIGSTEIASGATVTTISGLTLTSPTVNTPTLTLSTTSSVTEGIISWNTTLDKIIVGDGTTAREFASSTLKIDEKTAAYTLVLADKDKFLEINIATANNLTVPTNASVSYPIGTQINLVQTGAGQVTIVGDAGVTVNGTPGLKFREQWSSATLIKRATDTWIAIGDLSA